MKRATLALLVVITTACSSSGGDDSGTAVPSPTTSSAASVSPLPSPSAEPEPLPLPEARFEGTYRVRITATKDTFLGNSGFQPQTMRFQPKCDQGACDVTLSGKMVYPGNDRAANDDYVVKLANFKRNYQGIVNGFFARCGDTPSRDRWTFALKVDRAAYVGDEWKVTKFSGTWSRDSSGGGGGCSGSIFKGILKGTLQH